MTWAATQAKAKFSEVLDKAEEQGPQSIQRRKRRFVLLTEEQYAEHAKTSPALKAKPFVSAWDAMRPSSGAVFDVEFPRLPGKPRKVSF